MALYQEEFIVQYLLNKLSEQEKEQFEESFFTRDEVFEQLKIVEMKLTDRFVRQEMTADEEKEFRENFINMPEREALVAEAVTFHAQLRSIKTDFGMENSIATIEQTGNTRAKEIHISSDIKSVWRNNWREFFGLKNPAFAVVSVVLGVLVLTTVIFITSRNSNENLVVEVINNNQHIENKITELPLGVDLQNDKNKSAGSNQENQITNQSENLVNKNSSNSDKRPKVSENTAIVSSETILVNLEPGNFNKNITTANPKGITEQEIKLTDDAEKVSFLLGLNPDINEENFTVTILKRTGETVESFKKVKGQKTVDGTRISISVPARKFSPGIYSITVIGQQIEPIVYRFKIVREN